MQPGNFQFCEKKKIIRLSGKAYDEDLLNDLLKLIISINTKYKNTNIIITGSFDSKLILKDLISNKKKSKIEEILITFQKISSALQTKDTTYTSKIKGIAQGPAMELALSCNFIKADKTTLLKLEETSNGIIPVLGTTQRLTRLIGYQNTLQAYLLDKKITYSKGLQFELFNNKVDNNIKIENKSFFWDQLFTNTFIFYNSKIHSTYKNKSPAYNAILSIIFECSVCHHDVGLSVEQRWLKWLINHEFFNYSI